MVEITFELTRRCNYDCAHCMRDFRGAVTDLPLNLLRSLLDQAKAYGVRKIAITGGEPTLHPQFAEALDHIVSRGFEYTFVTNSSTFIKRVLPLMSDSRRREALHAVFFSLEGSRAEIHDRIRGDKSFSSVMRAVAACKMRDIPFGLSATMGQLNRHDLDQIALLASHLGAKLLTFDHAHPTPDNHRLGVPLPLEQWRDLEQDVFRLGQALKLPIAPCQSMYNPDPLYMCPTQTGSVLHVDFQGHLVFCCTLSGYRHDRDAPRSEIVADLKTTPLFEAHRKFIERVQELTCARLDKLEQGRLRPGDYFPCMSCHRYFGHLEWTDEY